MSPMMSLKVFQASKFKDIPEILKNFGVIYTRNYIQNFNFKFS